MTVLVVQHEPEAPPAQLGEALAAAGLEADVRSPLAGDGLPPSAEGLDALAVLGGSMDATDPELPHLADTRALIADAAARGIPVLGLCLGGQLCALALGGEVARRPGGFRIGWHAVSPLAEDPVTEGLGAGSRLFHWHQDAFTTPPGAQPLLAGGDGFRMGSVTALQVHPEVTPDVVGAWVAMEGAAEQLAAAGVGQADVLDGAAAQALHGRRLLDAWCAGVAARRSPL